MHVFRRDDEVKKDGLTQEIRKLDGSTMVLIYLIAIVASSLGYLAGARVFALIS